MEVINNLCQATQRILGSCFRSTLNRFASADSIVPNPVNPQSFNRYSYVNNNPINFSDPSGHFSVCNHDGSICSVDTPLVESLWIPEDEISAVQYYGNTQFAHSLGDGWDNEEAPPNYGYSQGLHGGLDLFAEPGTSVTAGVSGRVVTIERNAFRPQYIEIEVAPGLIIRIGHLTAYSTDLVVGDSVTPETVIGTVSASQGHVHIEFERNIPNSIHDELASPFNFMSNEMVSNIVKIADDPRRQNYAGTHFYSRSDNKWTTMMGQPILNEYQENLNVGQGDYEIPDSWK